MKIIDFNRAVIIGAVLSAVSAGVGSAVPNVFAQGLGVSFKAPHSAQDTLQFMRLRNERQDAKIKPERKFKIDFALVEYYLNAGDLFDARRELESYVRSNATGVSVLLANVFLFKIASQENDLNLVDAIKKDIFNQKLILLFDTHKVIDYQSLFGNQYTVRYFVDRIEILLNGDVLEIIRS